MSREDEVHDAKAFNNYATDIFKSITFFYTEDKEIDKKKQMTPRWNKIIKSAAVNCHYFEPSKDGKKLIS